MTTTVQGPTAGSSTVVVFKTHFLRGNRGSRRLREGRAPTPKPVDPGRVPRISRLMALAIRLDGLVRSGAVRDYADLARLGHVSKARVSQIMNLLSLAPDLQEQLLFLPRTVSGRDPVTERQVRPIAAVADWGEQRLIWATCQASGNPFGDASRDAAPRRRGPTPSDLSKTS